MAILKAAPNMALSPDGADIAGGGANWFSSMSVGGDTAGWKYRNASLLGGLGRLWRLAASNFRYGVITLASHTRHRQRLTVTKAALDAAGTLTLYEVRTGDGAATAFQLQITSAGLIRARDGITTRESFDIISRLGDLIDIEIDLDGAGDLHVYLYDGADRASTDHADAFVELNGAFAATNFSDVWMGGVQVGASGAAIDFVYVSEITSSETPTPYVEPVIGGDDADRGNLVLAKLVAGDWVEMEMAKMVSGDWVFLNLSRIGPPEEPEGGPVSTLLVPESGCWCGAETPNENTVGTTVAGLQNLENWVGRTPDIIHFYTQPWNGRLTNDMIAHRNRPGKPTPIILHNTKLRSPSPTFTQIANGTCDAEIDALAAGLRQRTDRHFLTLYHEPEDNVNGTTNQEADYVDAWDHFTSRLRSQGVTPAADGGKTVLVWNMMGYRDWGTTMWNALVPASSSFDWWGFDPYARDSTRYLTPAKMFNDSQGAFAGFYAYAMAHPVLGTKPGMCPEWGVKHAGTDGGANYSEAAERDFVASIPGILQASFPGIKAMVHWGGVTRDANNAIAANYQLYNRATAQQGYRTMFQHPYMRPRLDQIPA